MTSPARTAYDDQLRRRMTDAIRQYTCWVTYVSDDVGCPCCALEGDNRAARRARARNRSQRTGAATSFAYTTGLHGVGHPELAVFDLPADVSTRVLTALAHEVSHGGDLTPGELMDTRAIGGPTFLVEDLPDAGRFRTCANWFYRRPSSASVSALRLRVVAPNQII